MSVNSESPQTSFELRPASDFSLVELADLFSRTYVDYFFPVHMSVEMLSWIVVTQSIDLAASHVASVEDEHVGFIFISSRGLLQRVAAMGVLPDHRCMGIGRIMLESSIANAKRMGYRRMLLEIIEGNTAAMALYQHLGFQPRRQLVGWDRPVQEGDDVCDDKLTEIDPREVAWAIVHEGDADLPWQRSGDSMFSVQPPSRAYTLGGNAFCVVSRITDHSAYIDAFLVPRAKRRNGWGRRLMKALFAHYPGRAWTISATVPDDLAPDFFRRSGFQPGLLSQVEMELDLTH
ncbi:MAG: GNAT family N-acetyltransferase [bacterium]